MKRSVLIGGVFAILVLLAGAAFVAGRLLKARQQPIGAMSVPMGGVAGGGQVTVELRMESAEELPDSPPDVIGAFARREDNSIFVNEASGGGIAVSVSESGADTAGGGIAVSGSGADTADGRQIEIVVANETLVYKDVTAESGPPSGGTIRQQVEPGSIDGIGENSVLVAWGERRGDRLVARVLVYSEPMMITAPGGN